MTSFGLPESVGGFVHDGIAIAAAINRAAGQRRIAKV